jgi:hypothetical protein
MPYPIADCVVTESITTVGHLDTARYMFLFTVSDAARFMIYIEVLCYDQRLRLFTRAFKFIRTEQFVFRATLSSCPSLVWYLATPLSADTCSHCVISPSVLGPDDGVIRAKVRSFKWTMDFEDVTFHFRGITPSLYSSSNWDIQRCHVTYGNGLGYNGGTWHGGATQKRSLCGG